MSFQHAAISKGLMISCAVTSIAASIFDVKHYLHLQLFPHLTKHHQYWRLLVHHLAFTNSSELLLAEILLYNVSVPIERMFGSSKFAAFSVSSVLTATILEFGSLIAFNRLGLNVLPSGPITLVFSILYQFSRLVPRAYTFRIFGLTVTNKIFIYILALQLAISQPPGSLVSSLIGIVAGQLYRSDVLGLKTFRVPPTVRRLASRYLLPLIGSTKPPRLSNRAFPEDSHRLRRTPAQRSQENTEVVTTAPTPSSEDQADAQAASQPAGTGPARQSVMREWVDELTGRTERAAAGLRVPSEGEINQLTSMFPDLRREDIVGALQRR
ncbi:uncharacterized protein FOMMEDRAFT_88708 [Fomitiporia mediterranea MF3/22]|uniref:uncharacterized protein n=1 Tax=Fomitiporia mediterranea (strain MF3/22) TaxID=694068 RepID=UPI0004409CDE|nr:uncharacterized protein FOMMEDRAFT_88708 [Fomitiporia mediterranea MF3/22]EJD01385.1 hypothetical protein FOMMEDRAFT_88708 [Fomitiporia mediterranea MF3/22]